MSKLQWNYLLHLQQLIPLWLRLPCWPELKPSVKKSLLSIKVTSPVYD